MAALIEAVDAELAEVRMLIKDATSTEPTSDPLARHADEFAARLAAVSRPADPTRSGGRAWTGDATRTDEAARSAT
ncbi:hypothetical protein [Nocardia sp. CC227C]|uniref:hypothetical protein n=1 Tax=Nocardia sp. CC227C TaxID=3044562 RepID=UPI00278BEEFD|nr:hypothetical protein [Nocardia sp. CC227C]